MLEYRRLVLCELLIRFYLQVMQKCSLDNFPLELDQDPAQMYESA